ncbi:MAG: tRNA (adenine-N1)-methyltransferase [Actinomycetaceae bacterium]|nr:tRNA (adenine-N1)-methyltransferase [Actinomycetaceae bacterium]MDY6083214.1 tRNA (adenine-N1)-methyltransferase [Actinomycetaceae bacterium]
MQSAERRRGVFRPGDRVQLTDPKGRHYTISLTSDGYFHSTRGSFAHSELIGKPEGSVIDTKEGKHFLALRPLQSDYVLSMPRGATVIYPKDAAQIVHQADIFPGARVFEAGLGSGALSLALLAAVGEHGSLTSVERRPEFAQIGVANVVSWYGAFPSWWDVQSGEAEEILHGLRDLDVVVLDMLAPWELVAPAADALRAGGVIIAYITTTTQLSRFVEQLRTSHAFTEPEANETLQRSWHVQGLSVRPNHQMVGHTGFLAMSRRLAVTGCELTPTRRPAPAAQSEGWTWDGIDFSDLEDRAPTPKKLRRIRRDIAHRADVEEGGTTKPGAHFAAMAAQLDEEIRASHNTQSHRHTESSASAPAAAADSGALTKNEETHTEISEKLGK